MSVPIHVGAQANRGIVGKRNPRRANATSAPEHIGYIKTAATSYAGPSNQTTPVHFGLQAGQKVNIVCFTEGQSLNGNSYWFRIGQAGNLGFVHRDAIAPGVGMPHC